MNFKRLHIVDGDLIFVYYKSGGWQQARDLRDTLLAWVKNANLGKVAVQLHQCDQDGLMVLSVHDIFEEEVLKS